MITRHHQKDGTASVAVYSPCESYRYSLRRTWDTAAPSVMFLMLNPSTATEEKNDPTIERCERRARAMQAGSFLITNLFAFRATDPADLRRAQAPVGPENDQVLVDTMHTVDMIIGAWGAHGDHMDRATQVRALLASCDTPLFHLGLTKHGHPRHPLYLPYTQQAEAWNLNEG